MSGSSSFPPAPRDVQRGAALQMGAVTPVFQGDSDAIGLVHEKKKKVCALVFLQHLKQEQTFVWVSL